MARPREFDNEKAIKDAMNVFWAYGYEGASISTLLAGMGLTKGSLYKAYTDKKTLFLIAMTLYEQEQVLPAMDMLRDKSVGDGDTRIAKVFQSIPKSVHGGDRRGCMLCSAAAGPAFDDDGIAVVVNGLLDQLRDAFSYALGPRAPAGLAGLLVTQYVGLRILSRAQTSVAELEKSVAAVIEMVGPRDI